MSHLLKGNNLIIISLNINISIKSDHFKDHFYRFCQHIRGIIGKSNTYASLLNEIFFASCFSIERISRTNALLSSFCPE